MKGSAKELVIMVISIVFVLVLIAVGAYFYFIENDRSKNADEIMSKYSSNTEKSARSPEQIIADLEQAKNNLEIETINLRYYRTQADMADYPVNTAMTDSYTLADTSVDNIVNKTNAIKDNNLDKGMNIIKTKIKQVLEQWKTLVDNSIVKDTKVITKAKEYAKIIESNIEELKTIVELLTPESSGLTPSQIENYQIIVDNAVREINNSVFILEIAQPGTPSNNSNSPNTPNI